MTKKLNKNTAASEELFKRLESNDSEGLDDFEKEALEGFASLENPELAKSLNDTLHSKINDVYFEKKSGNRTFFYLSMAAGFVVVIGLSVLFYTFFTGQKQELALNKEAELTEKLPDHQAGPLNEANVVTAPAVPNTQEEADKSGASGKVAADKDQRESNKQADALEQASVNTKVAEGKHTKTGDFETTVSKPSEEANNGPTTTAAAPIVVSEVAKEPMHAEKALEKEAPGKADIHNKDLDEAKPRSTVGGSKKKTAKANAPAESEKKEASKGEGLADDYKKTEEASKLAANQSAPAAGAAASTGTTRREDGLLTQPVFATKNYSKAQDYIKSEIDKNTTLKNNIKEFTAKLTIDEKGIVTKVKFVSSFANCVTCEKDLETILLKMPSWQAATQGGKKVKETMHFVYP